MIGYAVGEVVSAEEGEEERSVVRWRPQGSQQCYEVVTTWVHPGYRGLSVSINMYLTIIRQGGCGLAEQLLQPNVQNQHFFNPLVPASFVMCDMLQGSVERVIASNIVFRVLERAKLRKYILILRQQSYTVVTQVRYR